MKTITEKILELKKEKNAVILAHYYQEEAIQDLADYVGASTENIIRELSYLKKNEIIITNDPAKKS